MSDELALRKDAERAAQARALLDSPLFKQAFDTLEADYIRFLLDQTRPGDTDARERMWQAVQILRKVRTHFETAVDDGKVAEAELNAMARNDITTR